MPSVATYMTVESIYIAYYQRPGDPSGVRFWADYLDANNGDLGAIIDAFATSQESLDLYGPPPPQDVGSTTEIHAFINSIYQALFGRDAEAGGLEFYTDGYIAGTFTQGSIALDILNGATGADRVAINNKIEVASTFTETVDGRTFDDPDFGQGTSFDATYEGEADAQAAREFLATVTSDPTTIPSDTEIKEFIKSDIADPGDPILSSGVSFILTPAIDIPPEFAGTPDDDTFSANDTTLNPGDGPEGGGGFDTLNYSASKVKGGVFEAGFTTGSIELVNITADGNVTIDASGMSDVETIVNQNSRADLTVTNGDEIVDLEFNNTTVANNFTVAYQAATVAGGNDTQEVYVDGVLNPSTLTVNGIEHMVVVTGDTASSFYEIASNTLQSFEVEGTVGLWLDVLNFPGSGSVHTSNTGDFGVGALTMGGAGSITFMNDGYASVDTLTLDGLGTILLSNTGDAYLGSVTLGAGNSTIDASGLGGMMDVTLDNAAAVGRNVAVTGSGSDDFLDVTAGFDMDDTFDGAGGTNDEIDLDPSNFSVGQDAIAGTESANLVTGTLESFDLAQFDTALELVAVNTSTSWMVDFLNLEVDGSELISIDNWQADLDGKTLSFDFDGLYFGQATLNLEIYNIDEDTAVDLQDTDTSGFGWIDPVGTLNLGAWGSAELSVHLDPWGNLGVLGLEGDADIVITSDAPTVFQVNGGTTTGDVTISAGVLSNSGATVVLGSGFDTVFGGSGDDTIDIDSGGGVVTGGGGNDDITADGAGSVDFFGGDGADTLTGSDDGDLLVGGNGADDISGRAGNDDLVGDGGNDTLDGEEGSDWIFGGIGADEMTGGADPDTFYYDNTNQSQGAPFSDLITDFESGVDFIDLLDALLPANPSVTSMDDVRFTGNAPGFAAAQASLSGLGGVEIVFDTLNHQLYIDVDGNGVIDGAIDMIIRFDDLLDSMQAGDFGIATGNVYTAAVIGFDTDVAADSFENTTTSNADDIVNALANQLPGSTITGYGGYNVMNVTSPITVATDLGDFMASDFDRLNLPGGTTAPVIGPDQSRNLDIYIGNGGSDFTTGTNLFTIPPLVQTVSSGSGDDDITLSNYNDNASTHAGSDTVTVTTDFDGSVDTGEDDDAVILLGGTTLGSNAVLMGGGQGNDEIQIEGASVVDITGAAEISGWAQIDYQTTGNVWLTIDQYNALTNSGNPVEDSNLFGTENMVFFGAGTADLDADLDEVGMGDDSTQTLILGDDDTDIVGGGTGDTTVVSNIADLDGSYDGGGGFNTFRQNVNQDFTASGAVTFTNFDNLTLGVDGINGVDVTMSNTQHNEFSSITGMDYPGQIFPFIPFNGNTVTITDVFNGTTQNTVEDYVLNGNGATTYWIGGNNQVVTDNNTAGHTVNINNSVHDVTLTTDGGAELVNLGLGNIDVSINTGTGNDTVTAVNGGTDITINTGDGNDTVSLNGTHTGLSVNTGNDNDLVVMQAGNSLSGTIDVGSGNDTLNFEAGDYHNVNFVGMGGGGVDIVNLTFAPLFTFTGSQYTNLIANLALDPIQINVDANATINIFDTSSVDFSNNFGPTGTFGTLVMLDGGSVNYTAGNFGNIQSLGLEGGADQVTLNNATYEAAANDDYLTINGFAVGSDMIRLQNAGAANGAYQEITASGTALSIGPNGVVEIASGISALIAPAGPLNTLDAGTVEGIIAGAVGDVASLGGAASFFAVLYANDGAAYIYQASVTAGGDLVPANFSVELVGQLNGVAADSMSLGNFFS